MFRDRVDAGQRLAERLLPYRAQDPVIVSLPRGGAQVGFQIAVAIRAPLDVLVVRKVGVPDQPELALGALAEGGELYLDRGLLRLLDIPDEELQRVVLDETAELSRRVSLYRRDRPPLNLRGRTAIVVDDGVATGSTVRVALQAIRKREPRAVVLAVPVAAADTAEHLLHEVDGLVCLEAPEYLHAISLWYEAFAQLTDEDVVFLLERATRFLEDRPPSVR